MDIQVKNLSIRLGKRQILNSVSLQAREGCFTGLIGPNGSGKSTLLKCIYRVLQPDSGQILLGGRELWGMSVRDSAKALAVLAQNSDLPFDFSVEKMVLMGRYPHKNALESDSALDYEWVEKALRLVDLLDYRERMFSTLSGGEKQRVLLARALAQDTPILILDEPTNHLDIKFQLQVMSLCHQMKKTVISAVHDLNIAAQFCDQVFALKGGSMVADGSPDELFTSSFIRELYETEAERVTDREGKPRIFFYASKP